LSIFLSIIASIILALVMYGIKRYCARKRNTQLQDQNGSQPAGGPAQEFVMDDTQPAVPPPVVLRDSVGIPTNATADGDGDDIVRAREGPLRETDGDNQLVTHPAPVHLPSSNSLQRRMPIGSFRVGSTSVVGISTVTFSAQEMNAAPSQSQLGPTSSNSMAETPHAIAQLLAQVFTQPETIVSGGSSNDAPEAAQPLVLHDGAVVNFFFVNIAPTDPGATRSSDNRGDGSLPTSVE
jgi:hypothetical protein